MSFAQNQTLQNFRGQNSLKYELIVKQKRKLVAFWRAHNVPFWSPVLSTLYSPSYSIATELYEVGPTVAPILQMRKLRHSSLTSLAQNPIC